MILEKHALLIRVLISLGLLILLLLTAPNMEAQDPEIDLPAGMIAIELPADPSFARAAGPDTWLIILP